jgi:hypothetical protein
MVIDVNSNAANPLLHFLLLLLLLLLLLPTGGRSEAAPVHAAGGRNVRPARGLQLRRGELFKCAGSQSSSLQNMYFPWVIISKRCCCLHVLLVGTVAVLVLQLA